MLFEKRKDFSTQFSPTPALGASAQISLTREFHIESLCLSVPVTISGSDASAAIGNGLLDIVKRVTLSVQDGQQNRNVFDLTGAGAIQYAATLTGNLDSGTNAARNTAGGKLPADATYIIRVPLLATLPIYNEPLFSRFLLPAPRYQSNPTLTVLFASKAQVTSDTDVTVTLGAPTLEVNRRVVNINAWTVFDFDVVETSQSFTASGQQIVEIPTPGSYTSLTLLNNPADPAHADILGGGEARIQRLGVTVQRFNEALLAAETDSKVAFVPFPGCRQLDFVSDGKGQQASLDSVLDANALANTGARIQLIQAIAGSCVQNIIAHRILGDITALNAKR